MQDAELADEVGGVAGDDARHGLLPWSSGVPHHVRHLSTVLGDGLPEPPFHGARRPLGLVLPAEAHGDEAGAGGALQEAVRQGVVHDDAGLQVVFIDTPGIHKPRYRMNEEMVRLATRVLREVDLVAVLADASEGLGPGDRFVFDLLRQARSRNVLVKETRILQKRFEESSKMNSPVFISRIIPRIFPVKYLERVPTKRGRRKSRCRAS